MPHNFLLTWHYQKVNFVFKIRWQLQLQVFLNKSHHQHHLHHHTQTLTDLYKQYVDVCKHENSRQLSFPVFSGTLTNIKFCLFKPRKDPMRWVIIRLEIRPSKDMKIIERMWGELQQKKTVTLNWPLRSWLFFYAWTLEESFCVPNWWPVLYI